MTHPIILAIWESEIRRIAVQSKPDPISTAETLHTCHLATARSINRRITDQDGQGEKQDPISKITRAKGLEAWLK
jgi:hypothetical protein